MKVLLLLLSVLHVCVSQQCDDVYVDCITFNSCEEILAKFPDTPSGYYSLGKSTEKVFCDMEDEHCGSKGWTRVAYVDMFSPTSTCPGNLTIIEEPIRSCGGPVNGGCAVAVFSTYGIKYSQVCGRVEGYQKGIADAFGPFYYDSDSGMLFDGVQIAHGEKYKKHIWGYVTGVQRKPTSTTVSRVICPCSSYTFNGVIAPPVGNHYYCDSGVDGTPSQGTFYTDPLWAGQNCEIPSVCCDYSGMPWFCRTLPEPTLDDIEVRNCHNQPSSEEDTAVALIELYIR